MSAARLPGHIVKRLSGSGGSRYLSRTRCQECRAHTLIGLDDEVCALVAVIDPDALSPLGEVGAALSGRRTYELRAAAGRGLFVTRRSRWRIAYAPAGSSPPGVMLPFDVVAAHRCGAVLPTLPTRLPLPDPQPLRGTDDPPF